MIVMLYVEAPEEYEPDGRPTVFLAGGITGCEDWQAYAREKFADDDIVVFNPRRADFDVTRGDSAAQQVDWEFRHLAVADVVLFWFPECDPKVTVQPIAMFELGAHSGQQGRRIVVGRDEKYPRKMDIDLQLHHVRPETPVHTSIDDVISNVRLQAVK